MDLKVITWNLGYWTPGRFNGRDNRRKQWQYLLGQQPDIALLQECRPPDLGDLVGEALSRDYAVIGDIPEGWTACSAILHRRDLDVVQAGDVTPWFCHLSGYLTRATVTGLPPNRLQIASVHAPAKPVPNGILEAGEQGRLRRTGVDGAWYNDLASAALEDWLDGPFLVAGDWNVARLFDTKEGNTSAPCAEFFSRRAEAGWSDTVRLRHADEVRTWFKDGQDAYQLDHVFTDPGLAERLVTVDVDSTPAEAGLSDHAPIVATFTL